MNSNDKGSNATQRVTEAGLLVDMLNNGSLAGLDVGSLSAPSITAVLDLHGATQIVDNGGSMDDPSPQLRGSGEPGSVVTIYDNGQVLGQTLVDKTGGWSLQVFFDTLIEPGEHTFTVVNEAGEGSEPFKVTVTAADVAQPVITSAYDNVDETGTIISGGNTDDSIPTFFGLGEPGTYVYLYQDDKVVSRALVGADGNWTIDSDELSPGQHVFTVRAHGGEHSPPFVLNVTAIPDIPSNKPVIESIYDDVGQSGTVVSGGSTDDNIPTFSGKGEPGIRIYLFEGNTRLASTVVDADGSWTISGQVWLAPGEHVFTLTDNNGERSEPFVLNVTEATLGKPVIESAVDNIGVDIGLMGNGAITDDARPTLKGHGEPNTAVSLYVDGRYMVSAVVAEDGSWSLLSPRALTPGEHVFTVRGDNVVSDPFVLTVINAPQAATLVIESAIDQTGPVTGVIGDGSATDEHQPVFRGHGEPDAPVFLFVSTGGERLLVGSGVVQSDGTWEVGIDINLSVASGHNVFTVSDGVSDSAPFTLHIGSDESTLRMAAQADTVVDLEPLTLSLSDLLQDVSSELFTHEVALPLISDVHPELDLGVVVETDGGVNVSVGVLSLILEPELAHVA